MIRPPRNVFYVQRGNSDFVRIVSFSEYTENEMVFGFFGLSSEEDPNYAYEYEDKILNRKEMRSMRTDYVDAKKKNNTQIDHFTIHKEKSNFSNGEFHLKVKYRSEPIHKVPLPPPIDNLSPEFLDFFILSDFLSKYSTSPEKPTDKDIVISAPHDGILIQRVRFSGLDFPLDVMIAEEEAELGKTVIPIKELKGKTIRGGITWEFITPKQDIFNKRHNGTYVIMSFPEDDDTFRLKTFVFN